jgi:hypothetical protein
LFELSRIEPNIVAGALSEGNDVLDALRGRLIEMNVDTGSAFKKLSNKLRVIEKTINPPVYLKTDTESSQGVVSEGQV